MPSKTPGGLLEARLGDLVEIVTTGVTAQELAVIPEVHHYSLPAFDKWGRADVVPGATIKSNKTTVPTDCILFSKLNPRIPRIWRVKTLESPNSYCSTEFWPLVARTDSVDLDYLAHFVGSEKFLGHPMITPSSSTNSHQRVDRQSFESFSVSLPPLDKQRHIAEILRSTDETISAQYAVCDQVAATFGCLAEVSFDKRYRASDQSWPISRLGELCESIQVGIVVRPASYYVQHGGVPALRSLNVHENRLDLNNLVYISDEGHRLNGKSSLRPGDIVTRRTGEPGKTAVVPAGFASSLNCIDIIFSRPKEILRAEFVSFFMNSDAAKRQIVGLQGGLAQQHLNVTEIKNIQVPLPSLEVQDEIVFTLKSAGKLLEHEEAVLQGLKSLKSAIASDLLYGSARAVAPEEKAVQISARPIQPAFKRAVLAAEIVHQLHKDQKFGSVKHEKIVHLCEYHADLHSDIDRHAYKKAAGPYDPKARRSVEANFKSHNWFDVKKHHGGRIEYIPMQKCGEHKHYFDRYFASQRNIIQSIIDLMRPLDSQRCEIIATLYAVWNDYLINGIEPTDGQIVDGARNNWHVNKQTIPEDRWAKALTWMRQKSLVPHGTGGKTRVATA